MTNADEILTGRKKKTMIVEPTRADKKAMEKSKSKPMPRK